MNRRELDQFPGELLVYQASFDNENSRSMSWPGVPVLQLKRGCTVMLVWNKSEDLKNGSVGVFTGVQARGVLPYMGYIGMCRCEGYGFQAVYSRIGYINQSVWV